MAASYSILTPQPDAGSGGTNPEFNRLNGDPAAATESWAQESLSDCDILRECDSRCLRVSFFLWDILGHFGTPPGPPAPSGQRSLFSVVPFRAISCHFAPPP